MADVGGPTSRLPGARLELPPGTMCDDHPDVSAVVRIQGETDSMGYEALDMCQHCYDQLLEHNAKAAEELQFCDRCNRDKIGVKPIRDPEEGLAGPVYNMCPECSRAMIDAFCDDEDD